MLAFKKNKGKTAKCTPNILPCKINHNGPVIVSQRYWKPVKTQDGLLIAYFRGRKLHGRKLHLPQEYRGIIVSKTDRVLPTGNQTTPEKKNDENEDEHEHEDEDEHGEPMVKILEEQSEFENIMVWGHESLPEDTEDTYVKGIEEWIGFSNSVWSHLICIGHILT